jgi:hypothetical protein
MHYWSFPILWSFPTITSLHSTSATATWNNNIIIHICIYTRYSTHNVGKPALFQITNYLNCSIYTWLYLVLLAYLVILFTREDTHRGGGREAHKFLNTPHREISDFSIKTLILRFPRSNGKAFTLFIINLYDSS